MDVYFVIGEVLSSIKRCIVDDVESCDMDGVVRVKVVWGGFFGGVGCMGCGGGVGCLCWGWVGGGGGCVCVVCVCVCIVCVSGVHVYVALLYFCVP